MAQALPDPYSGLARGLQMGQNMKMQHEQMMLQKAESKLKNELALDQNAYSIMANPDAPDQVKVDAYNSRIPSWEKRFQVKIPKKTEWDSLATKYAKKVSSIAQNKDMSGLDKQKMIVGLNLEYQSKSGKSMDLSGVYDVIKKEERRGLLETPAIPGLPAETAPVGQGLTLTRGEVPELPSRPTAEAQKMTPTEKYSFIETGKESKPEKNIERTVDLGNKVRIFYMDGTREDIPKDATPGQAGKSDPWTRGAMSILDKEYGTLTDFGYEVNPDKAEERRNAITYLEDFKKKGIKFQDAAILAIRKSASGGTDPIQEAIDRYREMGKTDKEIRGYLKKSKYKAINPRIYGLK